MFTQRVRSLRKEPPCDDLAEHGVFLAGILLAAVGIPAAASATTPGRNGLIAFSASTPAGTQLFTVWPNGKNLHQITHVAGDAANVDWPPDGRRLVFTIGN